MILLNLVLAGGLAAAAVPVLVHILHRRRLRRIDWSAMRFLRDLLARSRRRLMIEEWLLLVLRTVVLLLLAFALMRPASPPAQVHGDVLQRQGAVAAVIVLDDGPSAAAGRDETRFSRLQELALRYLDTLGSGDEVSVLRASQLGGMLGEPIYDLELARRLVREAEPGAIGADLPTQLDAGLQQFARHINPSRELVLVSDLGRGRWQPEARARWAELQRRLRPAENAATRVPSLLLLSDEPRSAADDVAIVDLRLDRSLVPVGVPLPLRVAITRSDADADDECELLLRVRREGHIIDERDVTLRGSHSEFVVPLTVPEPGLHAIEAELVGLRDALTAGDTRALVVEAVRGLPVLVVAGRVDEANSGWGSGRFISLALDPAADGEGAYAVATVAAEALATTELEAFRCLVFADVPALDREALAAVERWVAGGGGLLVAVGPDAEAAHINRLWARDGDGFLPAPLRGEPTTHETAQDPVISLPNHPMLSAFVGAGDAAFAGAAATRSWRFAEDAVPSGEIAVPLRWADGSAALLVRRRGLGRVAAFGGGADAAWSRLPLTSAWAPLLRGIVGELASPVRPPRNLRPGERLAVLDSAASSVVRGPDGGVLTLSDSTWDGRRVLASEPLTQPGIYRIGSQPLAVAISAEALDLRPPNANQTEQLLAGLNARRLATPEAIIAAIDPDSASAREWWPWLIMAVLGLLMVETWYAGRRSARAGERS